MQANQLNLVVIGKTGEGKSATLNTILEFGGHPNVRLVDTVGLFDTELTSEDDPDFRSILNIPQLDADHEMVLLEMTKVIALCSEGIHSFLMVVRAGRRFTKETKDTIKIILRHLGSNVLDHTVFVITGADTADANEMISAIKTFLVGVGLGGIGDRFVAFDNHNQPPGQVEQLLRVVQANLAEKQTPYTHMAFSAAKDALKKANEERRMKAEQELQKVVEQETCEIESRYSQEMVNLQKVIEGKAEEMENMKNATEQERQEMQAAIAAQEERMRLLAASKDDEIRAAVAQANDRAQEQFLEGIRMMEKQLALTLEQMTENSKVTAELQQQLVNLHRQNQQLAEAHRNTNIFERIITTAASLFGLRK